MSPAAQPLPTPPQVVVDTADTTHSAGPFSRPRLAGLLVLGCALALSVGRADDPAPKTTLPHAVVDGEGIGWVAWDLDDFAAVNCAPETWSFKDGVIQCTGKPVGVIRSQKELTNFELVVEWRHLTSGGNSGIFAWAKPESLEGLKPDQLPKGGIEVQILDHGYAEKYEKQTGKKPDWFTTNGDVFPVGTSKMTPFPPIAPNKSGRAFPRENRSKGHGEWNHYYVRAINGEVRLWVNGVEVSGGNNCEPRSGYLCLESEGAPVEFKNLRIRELP